MLGRASRGAAESRVIVCRSCSCLQEKMGHNEKGEDRRAAQVTR